MIQPLPRLAKDISVLDPKESFYTIPVSKATKVVVKKVTTEPNARMGSSIGSLVKMKVQNGQIIMPLLRRQ
jgi:hypothetical protein